MTLSPKHVPDHTECAGHRGVEAKDAELAHAHLDVTTSMWSRAESSAEAEREASNEAPPPRRRAERAPDDAGSYLQVVVEKHRRRREMAAAQTSPRLPSASSPLACEPLCQVPASPAVATAQLRKVTRGGGGDRGVYVLPHPVLLACSTGSPLCKALQTHDYYTRGLVAEAVGGAGGAGACSLARASAAKDAPRACSQDHVQKKNKTWKMFRDVSADNLYDDEPERVEVYYFEQGAGAWLATCDSGRVTWCERAVRRPAQAARALLAEALALPALVAAAPLALVLATQRAVLLLVRAAVTGAVQTTSDYALKPALTLTFNAVLQPLLVFAANVTRGLRAVVRPLAAALGDALEPLTRLVAAVRLVDVRYACDCEQRARV